MSNTRQTGIRLPELTQRQLTALCELTGMNQSAVMVTALDRMYQQEIQMKFADWNANTRYAENMAPGWIPNGTIVQFKADRATGRIVNGNSERSLVEYHPTSGGGWQREWFSNSELRIAA